MHTGFWWGNLKKRNRLEHLQINERIILKWIARKQDGRVLTVFSCLKTGQVTGFCERGNEPSGSVKCMECPNYMQN
jgi:hypothetical protein